MNFELDKQIRETTAFQLANNLLKSPKNLIATASMCGALVAADCMDKNILGMQAGSAIASQGEQQPEPEPIEDRIRRQFCMDREGTKSIDRQKITQTSRASDIARITIKTPDVNACDKFGTRTVTSIKFQTKGSSRKKWIMSEELLIQPLKGNNTHTVTRRLDLNNRCKTGDRHITIQQLATAQYHEFDSGKIVERKQKLPINFSTKISCRKSN
jgi:hypothetical protein